MGQRTDAHRPGAAALIEMCGVATRTEGLDEEMLAVAVSLTAAAPEEIVHAYRKDNTCWAASQSFKDSRGLTGLDEHLDRIA